MVQIKELEGEELLKYRATQTVTLFGQQLPMWADCTRCKDKLACKFQKDIGYVQPCDKCLGDPKFRAESDAIHKQIVTVGKVRDSLKAQIPTAVYEARDKYGRPTHNLTINHRGDVIKQEKYKPLKTGIIEKEKKSYVMGNGKK